MAARPDDVADLISARLAALTHDRAQALDDSAVRAVVHQAVQDVRSSPPPSPVDRPADPALAALRRTADGLAASAHLIGQLMLEVAPEHLSEAAAADVLAPLCEAIGEDLQHALASRRYVICGDRRALYGTVL